MNLIRNLRSTGWRWMLALVLVAGMEIWLLLASRLQMDHPAFEALCALSCWMPAWFCADLLSTRDRSPGCPAEWSLREVRQRAAVRLLPSLGVLSLWCGTFTLRALRHELTLPNPRFLANISDPNALAPTWIAWTTVFLASGFAYGGGAAVCSALARRSRRWLITPAVVIGASLVLALLVWALAARHNGPAEPLPFVGETSATDGVRHALTVPNYVFGSTTALFVTRYLSEHHEALLERLGQYVPPGISLFCWIATLAFLVLGAAAWMSAGWIARNRSRRHPNTAASEVPSASGAEEASLVPV